MSKQHDIFGKIRYWFRVEQLGLSNKESKYCRTLYWKRKNNASRRKACKEIEKSILAYEQRQQGT